MTSIITADRTTITNAVIKELLTLGFWDAERVLPTDDHQIVPNDIAGLTPFVQLEDDDTDYETLTKTTSRMIYPMQIVVYANLLLPQWTLQGLDEQKGIKWYMDRIREKFLRRDLNGLVHKTEVKTLGKPTPLTAMLKGTGQFEGFMCAIARLIITVETAG